MTKKEIFNQIKEYLLYNLTLFSDNLCVPCFQAGDQFLAFKLELSTF